MQFKENLRMKYRFFKNASGKIEQKKEKPISLYVNNTAFLFLKKLVI